MSVVFDHCLDHWNLLKNEPGFWSSSSLLWSLCGAKHFQCFTFQSMVFLI